jgi:hypothetical protein
MPFVEGETLRSRLDREKQLPVDEAVRIADAEVMAVVNWPRMLGPRKADSRER